MKNDNKIISPFYIYGAGIVAASIYTAWKHLYKAIPEAFLVSSLEKNTTIIDGIPVRLLKDIDVSDKTVDYVIATPKIHHSTIVEMLHQYGITDDQIFLIDNKQENLIMEHYYEKKEDFLTVKELFKEEKETVDMDIQVYQAKCHVDKQLQSGVEYPEYIYPVQTGTELTDQRIAVLLDNQGVNISAKNRNYCELTATYWAWKNRDAAYKGLCHYRRIFDITGQELRTVFSGKDGADVILPYPSVYYPDMTAEHLRYINNDDWEAMLQAIKKTAPEYYKAYQRISREPYFYNYNMLIARKEIFDDYSEFLFSVLEETESMVTPKGWERADRFAGYLAENLTTIYFRANKDRYKIAHVGKLWLT